ncbi:MAG: isoprenyl transferase [Muribaculaceae bacterium]|nr:isoprenyl transferase [Muribaculaceae bacterium]MDE6343522.1 isoprenyl transferase [Muribaculaceae bacterium]MDE6609575.1 isoprenyl transferase [Muribaculaceae bacterium]
MTKTTDIANTADTEITVDMTRVPDHVAVIMDGNGRWAQSRGLDRTAGHVEGVVAVRRVTEAASRLGIKYLTLYTFSTENWNRPKEEVDALMHLIVTAIERETPDLIKNNVRMTVIGDMSRMPELAFKRLSKCVEETSHCTGLTLVLAISYSSRWEIREAVRKIASKAAAGEIDAASVTDEDVASALATSGMPDPDLLIRTGGDFRVSNFLLYQIAYTEIYLTPTYWPDFDDTELKKAVVAYQSRQRRFGLTGEQVEGQQ